MFGSVVLEIFLGLAFFFLTFSLVVTTAQEMIAGLSGTRAATLVRAIKNLLDDPKNAQLGKALTDDVYNHPIIARLYRGKAHSWLFGQIGNGPSYIPNSSFAVALLDTLRRRFARDPNSAAPISTEELLGRAPDIVNSMDDGDLKDALTLVVGELNDAGRSFSRRAGNTERRISDWFDQAMDRASGWYKRRSQAIALLLAAGLAVALDADAIAMLKQLWQNAALRETLADAASVAAHSGDSVAAGVGAETQQLLNQILVFPIGWDEGEDIAARFSDLATGLKSVVGWAITALAVSLGSTFWFDLTKNVLRLRSSGPKPSDGHTNNSVAG